MTPWLLTYSGRRVNPMAPTEDDICIEDMAHAMANINRFNGHPKTPINLACHSLWVSKLCGEGVAGRQGLLHDGSEYLLGDVTKWLKHSDAMAGYRVVEDYVQAVIYAAFDCPLKDLDIVKWADTLMVRVEGEYAWGPHWSNVEGYGPLTDEERLPVAGWRPLDWQTAKHAFLDRYEEVR